MAKWGGAAHDTLRGRRIGHKVMVELLRMLPETRMAHIEQPSDIPLPLAVFGAVGEHQKVSVWAAVDGDRLLIGRIDIVGGNNAESL